MIVYIGIVFLSFLLVLANISLSQKLGFIDTPNERSSHKKPIPRSGGIGFMTAFFVSFLFFDMGLLSKYYYIFLSIFLVFLLGIYDDRYEISAKKKLVVISIATIVLWYYGVSIDSLGVFLSSDIALGIFSLPFTIFAVAGFTNALNLVDGLDGLSTTLSIVILSTFSYIGFHYNDQLIVEISLVLIASLVGFLLLNWNPAKIFMGDSGSLSIGFIISILAILSIKYIHPVTILYITALPILDTLVVMTRRVRSGLSPFKPDKTHIHHIMLSFFNGNVKKTVFFLLVLQIIFSIIGFLLISTIKHKGGWIALFALIIFLIMFILFYMIFTGIYRRQKYIDLLKKRSKS